MKIIKNKVELINAPDYKTVLNTVELATRTCYKSEDKMGEGTAEKLIRGCIKRGHLSTIEHAFVTVRITADRAILNEMVRHRLCQYSQESTRYVNYDSDKYGREIKVIQPVQLTGDDIQVWKEACTYAEYCYNKLVDAGVKPENARSVLPLCTASELVMTANMREWRHILSLRRGPGAHPDMREVADMIYEVLREKYPVFFEDL